jgi:hypothetical protein
MLFTERIVLLLSVYMAFIYGLLYLFLTAYPLVFQGVHGMNLGVGGLPFFGMITGQLLAGTVIFIRQPGYQKKLAANNNVPIPEWRLPEVIVGGICFSIGIFWFGWTGYKEDIHWIVPTLSGVLIGFGLLSIFLQALNYLVDAYLMVSHFPSAFSAATRNIGDSRMGVAADALRDIQLTLKLVCRLRHRSKHLPPLSLWRRLSAVRTSDVSGNGHTMGCHITRMHRSNSCSSTNLVLSQRREDQGEQCICANVPEEGGSVNGGRSGERGEGQLRSREVIIYASKRCRLDEVY